MTRKSITTWAALLVFLSTSHGRTTAGTLRTVAFSEDVAISAGSGTNFLDFSSSFPALNGSGQVALKGRLTGTGTNISNNTSIWSEGGGNGLSLIARTGDAAPGTGNGVKFSSLADILGFNELGEVAFRGNLTGTGVNNSNNVGIWSEGGADGLSLIARTGDAAPDTSSGVKFSKLFFIEPTAFNNAGQTAFRGDLVGSGVNDSNDSGIWSEGGGNGLSLIARTGDVALGTGGAVYTHFFTPALNEAGQIAFQGVFSGSGVNDVSSGIWSGGGGSPLALVARSGAQAPGTNPGVNFNGFSGPVVFNDTGQTVFHGNLTGPGVNRSNDAGIWSEGGGNGLTLIVRTGDAAPGTSNGVNFSILTPYPYFNNAGQTAFAAILTGEGVSGSNDFGIWLEGRGNGLSLIAREGSAVPGMGSGVAFTALGEPVLNDAGQVAFHGAFAGAGVNSSNNVGIWAEDRSGIFQLIARKGDLLDVDDGPGTDFREISSFSVLGIPGIESVRLVAFNNLGQLTFMAAFTDGTSGIFASNLVAIPEPSALQLASLALVGMLVWRKRVE